MREYKYDNLKCIMIFFVVFIHFLEIMGEEKIYTAVYTFHMPIFIFISGYFTKFSKKNIFKFTWIYVIWQTIYIFFLKYICMQDVEFTFIKPNWILWYIFSMLTWNIIIKLFDTSSKIKSMIFILLSIIISILVGFVEKIGYEYSLSRTITFFPYFLIGYYTKKNNLNLVRLKDDNEIYNKRKLVIVLIRKYSFCNVCI